MANRFWVGGTGTWDSSDTTHWASSTGGAGGQSVPGSSDIVFFDGNSGGGTCTLNFGGTITIQSLSWAGYTGTWDNSVNNNNITCTASSNAFNGSSTSARTIKLGTATYTLSSTSSPSWNFTTTTNLTLTASGATIAFTGGAATKTFNGGSGQTYGTVSFAASSGAGSSALGSGNSTVGTLTITAPNYLVVATASTVTVLTTLNLTGTSSAQIAMCSSSLGTSGSMALPAGQTADWCAFRDVTFTGNTLTANDSFDLGHNSGVTITAPVVSGGSSSVGVIGS